MPKQRTSKSWYVLIDTGTETYEVKVVGVSSAEAAMARAETTKQPNEKVVSARPMRKFKAQSPETCDTRQPYTETRCDRVEGHEGNHGSVEGEWTQDHTPYQTDAVATDSDPSAL